MVKAKADQMAPKLAANPKTAPFFIATLHKSPSQQETEQVERMPVTFK